MVASLCSEAEDVVVLLAFCLWPQGSCWSSCHRVCILSDSTVNGEWGKEVKRVPAHCLSTSLQQMPLNKLNSHFHAHPLVAMETGRCNHVHHYLKVPTASSFFPPLVATERPDRPSFLPPHLPLQSVLCPSQQLLTVALVFREFVRLGRGISVPLRPVRAQPPSFSALNGGTEITRAASYVRLRKPNSNMCNTFGKLSVKGT